MPKVVDHEERRLEISRVAALLISRGGLEAATIREIARESGYSKGVVEHYFENKEELIDGALSWANSQYERRVAQTTRDQQGLEAMRKRMEATLPMTTAVCDEWKIRLVFWGMAAIDPVLRNRQEKRTQHAVDLFSKDIQDAMAAGELKGDMDAASEARQLVNSITGISIAALHNRPLYTASFLRAELEKLLQRLTPSDAPTALKKQSNSQ